MRPTPKSITHKNPINISPSSNNIKNPRLNKYIPAKYQRVIIFIVFIKKIKEIIVKICKNRTSLSIFYTHKIIFVKKYN